MEDIPEGNPLHSHDPTQPPPPPPAPGAPGYPPPQPGYAAPPAMPKKPGKLTAIAIIMLVSGIFNLLFSLSMLIAALGTCVTILLVPLFLVAGILEIIHATKILKDPIEVYKPATGLAILEICCIIGCNFYSLVAGILNLVFWGDPQVKQYYRDVAIARGYQPQV